MPFLQQDLVLGFVAYFAVDDLRADGDIVRTGGSPDGKPRPFVCYGIRPDGTTLWTPLSTETQQSARTEIPKDYIVNATGRFLTDHVVVNDGRHTYAGTASSLAGHSHAHDRYTPATRVMLLAPALQLVLAAVTQRGGQLP